MQIMSMQHSLDACVYLMRFNYFFVAPSLKSWATHLLRTVSVSMLSFLWTVTKIEIFVRFQKFQNQKVQPISSKFTVKSQNQMRCVTMLVSILVELALFVIVATSGIRDGR